MARVELAAESTDTVVNFNGEPGTFIGIFPTPSANPLNTAAAVIEELPAIQASLPDGMTITIVYDSTETISASIEEVFKTIAEAVAIVIVVILLFLGSFRSVLMPVVTIPLSLIGVCFILLTMGYSINLLSLLAMVLAIGLVVDDAIVVVENIHRHIEEGMSPMQAAFKGMREIFGPVVAMTITLAAVFAPLVFTGGLTGVAVPRIRGDARRRRRHLRLRRADDHADDVGAPAEVGQPQPFRSASSTGIFERVANRYERLVSGSLNYRPVTLADRDRARRA